MAYLGKRRGSSLRVLAAGVALLLVASACGGDDGGDDAPSEEPSAEEPSEPEPEEPEEPEEEPDPDAPPFYEGKTITLWVASNPGGGADRSMQAFAAAIREHVEGNPEVELEYKAGAGGYEAGNDFFQISDHDGLTLLNVNLIKVTAWLAGEEGVGWDLNEMVPLGVLPPTHMWGVHSDTGITDVTELVDPPVDLIFGGRSPTATAMPDAYALGMLGIQDSFQEIYGYGGHSDMVLAFEQGEINFLPASSAGWVGSSYLIEDGLVNLLASHGVIGADGELHPDPAWPDVPVLIDRYEDITGEPPTGEFVETYKKLIAVFNSGATVALHQSAPQEAIDALRDGIARAVEDPAWIATKEELAGDIQVIAGDDLQGIADTWAGMTQDELTFIRDYLFTTYADILN